MPVSNALLNGLVWCSVIALYPIQPIIIRELVTYSLLVGHPCNSDQRISANIDLAGG